MTPEQRWVKAGLAALGGASGVPLDRDWPGRFDTLAAPLNQALAARGLTPVDLSVLGERATLLGLRAHGDRSANGTCRLLQASDGWIALNLARPEDFDLLAAFLETEGPVGEDLAAELIADAPAHHWVERGVLLGLAVAAPGEARGAPPARTSRHGETRPPSGRPMAVVDLSSLWAGPLCAHLLARLGADVVKVESRTRPDGARTGSPAFFERLNAGKAMCALDFADPVQIGALRDRMLAADVVIEASRPRALRQLGLVAEEILAARPGLVWLSITGHGREAPQRIAYGDDAAVAGGLVGRAPSGAPAFLGDAIADPLTGIWAAGAVVAAREAGGGVLLDVSLAGVAAFMAKAARLRRRAAA